MARNTYDTGDRVRCSVAFTVSGTGTDPTAVVFQLKDPSGTTTSYTYLTDAELIKDSTGNYYVDVTLDEPGGWFYRWAGTGAVVAADENYFNVRPSYMA